LRSFLGGEKATLLWDGLPAHRSKAMAAFVADRVPRSARRVRPARPDRNDRQVRKTIKTLFFTYRPRSRGLITDVATVHHKMRARAE
jgi:hypothetical protein